MHAQVTNKRPLECEGSLKYVLLLFMRLFSKMDLQVYEQADGKGWQIFFHSACSTSLPGIQPMSDWGPYLQGGREGL